MGTVRFVGMDVHKESIAIAVADGAGGEPSPVATIANDTARLLKQLLKLGKKAELRCCYEAGPTGYGLHRDLRGPEGGGFGKGRGEYVPNAKGSITGAGFLWDDSDNTTQRWLNSRRSGSDPELRSKSLRSWITGCSSGAAMWVFMASSSPGWRAWRA